MIDDKELAARIDLFMTNIINAGDVDNIVIVTNRGDRVGLHSDGMNGPSEAVAFAMLEKIVEHKKTFKDVKK